MMQCGGCTQQVVQQLPLLANPVTWMVVLAALTGVMQLGKKEKK